MSVTASSEVLTVRQHNGGASSVFKVLFWVHQVVLGLPSVGFGLNLLIEGTVQGVISVIGVFLAWIGGTLVLGLGRLNAPADELRPTARLCCYQRKYRTDGNNAGACQCCSRSRRCSRH